MHPAAHTTMSFIIPVRDDARRLERCLASIARNLYASELIQVIVVDNGSRDDSAQVARQAGALVVSAPGRVAELRNRGVQEATGELLAFVDADHELDVTWIRSAVHALSDPSIAAIGAPYSQPADANWIQRRYHEFRAPLSRPQDSDWLGSGNLAIRRAAFNALNGFDASLEACEDVDFCNRLRRAGYRLVADPALRSVHFGDPATLRALFFGELWRGRNNLRVTWRGPRTVAHFRSLLVPVVDLIAIAGAGAALAFRLWPLALVCVAIGFGLASLKALAMLNRAPRATVTVAVQSFIVALAYDAARALALLASGSHGARRSSEHPSDVTASSHS
jgi:glycosyltransferase involved in cell wall biosynthesis